MTIGLVGAESSLLTETGAHGASPLSVETEIQAMTQALAVENSLQDSVF